MAAGFTNVDPAAFAQGSLGDLNQLADQGNITAISRATNGGDHGLQAPHRQLQQDPEAVGHGMISHTKSRLLTVTVAATVGLAAVGCASTKSGLPTAQSVSPKPASTSTTTSVASGPPVASGVSNNKDYTVTMMPIDGTTPDGGGNRVTPQLTNRSTKPAPTPTGYRGGILRSSRRLRSDPQQSAKCSAGPLTRKERHTPPTTLARSSSIAAPRIPLPSATCSPRNRSGLTVCRSKPKSSGRRSTVPAVTVLRCSTSPATGPYRKTSPIGSPPRRG
jgi:hypothetical protein